MNDQYLQYIEDQLSQGFSHQEIIENIGNDINDEAAKFAAQELKKKEQTQQAGESASGSVPPSSASAGDDFFIDKDGNRLTADIPVAEVGATKDPESSNKKPELGFTIPNRGGLEGGPGLIDPSKVFEEGKQRGTDQFVAEQEAAQQAEIEKKFKELGEAVNKSKTTQDIEVAFENAGLDAETFQGFIVSLNESNPFLFRTLKAEEEFRSQFGAPMTGEYDMGALYNDAESKIQKLKAERERAKDLSSSSNVESRVLALEADVQGLNKSIEEQYVFQKNITDYFNAEKERDANDLKNKLSPESYSVYNAFNQAYSTSITNNLANLLKGEDGQIDESALRFYLTEMSKGTMDLKGVLTEIEGSVTAEQDLETFRASATEAGSEAAKNEFSQIDFGILDGKPKGVVEAKKIEKELKNILSIDFDGDGLIAPMSYYETYLSKLPLGRGMSLGALFNESFDNDTIENYWNSFLGRKIYEPLEKAVVSTIQMIGDIGASGNQFLQGAINILGGDTDYADDISDMMKTFKDSYRGRMTEFVPTEKGTLTFEGTLNQAMYSIPFTAIQYVGRRNPITGLLLFGGVGHDVYTRVKDEEWYSKMPKFGRVSYISGMTGSEFGTEMLGNAALFKGGKLFGAGLRSFGSTGLRRVGTGALSLGASTSVETGSELANLFLQTGLDNYMLTPYGVQAKPLFDPTEVVNTIQVAALMSGGVQAPIAGYTYVQQNREISNLKSEIDDRIKLLRSDNISDADAKKVLEEIMAKQSKLVGKYTDTAEYAQWMSENKPSDFDNMSQSSQKVQELLGRLRNENLTDAQAARVKSELAVALQNEYELSFVGLQQYLIETADNTPVDKLRSRIRSHKIEIDELRAERNLLEQRKRNGEDVRGDLDLVQDKITRMAGAMTAMESAISKAEMAAKSGDTKAERKALESVRTYVNKSEALENIKRIAGTVGAELNEADLRDMQNVHVGATHAYMLDADGNVISAFEHASSDQQPNHPPTAKVRDEDVLKMEEMGYVKLTSQDGITAMVYDPKSVMQRLFPELKNQETIDDALRVAKNAYLVTGDVTTKGQKSIKIDAMASAINQGMDVGAMSPELSRFYEDNKSRIQERIEQIAFNKENRKEEDLTDPGQPSEGGVLKNSRAETVKKLAEKMGLSVKVGTDAQLFADSGRGLDAYMSGAIVGGYYKGGNEIFISENATAKDVLEELAHAKIIGPILSDKNRTERFENELEVIMMKDPYLRAILQTKESQYREMFAQQGLRGDRLENAVKNEVLAEAISQYVADSSAFEQGTIDSMVSYVKGLFGSGLEIDVTKDNLDSIMAKLEQGLKSGRAINVVENQDQKTEETNDPVLLSQYSGKNSFLHNKEVTIQVTNYGGRNSYQMRPIKFIPNDYNHFRNWWSKMTGNGNIANRDLYFKISYTDENGKVIDLAEPKPIPGKELSMPAMASWRSRYQNSVVNFEKAERLEQEAYDELEELKTILVGSGMSQADALNLLEWNGLGKGYNVRPPSAEALAGYRQAVGDLLAEAEQTTPQSVVQFATYQDIVGSMNDVLKTIDGMPTFEIKNYRRDEQYRQDVDRALISLSGNEKAVREFSEKVLNTKRRLTNAELQNLLSAVSIKLHGGKRHGTSKVHRQNVVSALKVPMMHLMNTPRGKEFVNFFSDFRDGLPNHFEDVALDHGIDHSVLMEHKDLYSVMVAVLSNGNEAKPNIRLADYVYAAWCSGDKARLQLALHQVGNRGAYTGMTGIPTIKRTEAHKKGLEAVIDLYTTGEGTLLEKLQAPNPVNRKVFTKGLLGENQGYASYILGDKIGPFARNMLGDETVMAQDSHFVAEMLRARGIASPYDTKALKKAFDNAKKVKSEIKDKYGLPLTRKNMRENMEDIGRTIMGNSSSYTAAGKQRKRNLEPWEKDILTWYEGKVAGRLQRSPRNRKERDLNYTIATELANELGISIAAVQQLLFYDNHLTQQVFGRGESAKDTTFADILNEYNPSNFGLAIPNEASLESIKALDSLLRSQLVESDFGRKPPPAESFGLSELLEDVNIAEGRRFVVNPKIGEQVDVTSARTRSGNYKGTDHLTVGLSGARANAVVLEEASFPESKTGRVIGTVDAFANTKEDISQLNVNNSIEVEFINGQWRAGSEVVIGADKVTMIGNLVFAENPVYSESSEIAVMRAEQLDEDVNRYAGDPIFEEEVERAMKEDKLSREQAEIMAESVYFSTNIRGTAARVVESANFAEDLRKMVAENPANYFERSSLNDIRDAMDHMTTTQLLEYMRSDKLGELKTDENYGPLATITLINRYNAAGDSESAAALIQELASTGTSVGRLLRQFAELKTSSPESLSQVILGMAEARGKTVDDKTKKYVNEQTRIVFELHRKAQELFSRGQQGEDVWDEYQKALKSLATAEKDLDIVSNKIIERSWGELIRQTIQGNLLTTMSQSTNVVANLANFIPKTMVDVAAFPIERMLEKSFPDYYAKKAGIRRKLGLTSYLYGISRFGSGFMESLDEIATGKRSQDLTEWRISRSMMPLHSLMAFASSDLPQSKTKAGELNQRAKLLFQGTFGVPAESMFRLLSLGDTPFRRYAEGLELAQIADSRGLVGEEKKQFMRFPPDDVIQQARAKGLEFTFQNDTSTSQLAEYTLRALSAGMGKPFQNIQGFDGEDFFNTIIRMNVPYVRTPANLLEETLTYASPAIAMARVGKHLLEGNPRAASENFAKGMIGQGVTMTSMYLIANGLISGPPDDDKGLRSLQYDTFPPNCINVSGLRRLLQGGDPAYQKGDEFRNYQKLGLFGSIMGAAAVSTDKQAAEEIMTNPFGPTELFKRTFGFDNVATLSYMMDQSFLQGLNSSLQVLSISNPDEAERAWSQWVEGMFRSISAVPLPNQLSAINRSQRQYLPDMRSASMGERLQNTLRDRTFSTGSLPVRYNWKGEPIKQTPEGAGPLAYQLFDVTKSREGSSDPVSMEALRIYQDTGETIKVLDLPYFAQSVFRHINPPSFKRGKAKKAYAKGKKYQFVEDDVDFKMKLNAEQVNEALRMSASLRYDECSKFVASEEYKGMTDEARINRFESINAKYNGLVEFDPNGDFMPHTRYLMDLFEEEYLQRLQDGEEFEKN